MSSFDRKSAAGGASKKPIFVAVLMVALAVILVRQFGMARSTAAAPTDPNANLAAGAPPVVETTGEALRGLADDPTQQWLKAEAETDSALEKAPQDPFQMSPAWRALLIKPVIATVTQETVYQPVRTTDPIVKPVGTPWNSSGIKLEGIFKDSKRSYAIVNGSIVSEGMIVGGAKIVEVRDNSLLCQPLNSPDGASVEVPLKTRPH